MMHRLVLMLSMLVAASLANNAQAQDVPDITNMPLVELERIAPNEHPYGYFILAMRKFNAGDKAEGVRWFYVGQIRWRFHIAANPNLPPDGDPALLASMMEAVGRPLNEWAGGDVDQWIATMQAALEWDEANENGFTSKTEHASAYKEVRAGLRGLIASIEKQRKEIPGQRAQRGLENRAP